MTALLLDRPSVEREANRAERRKLYAIARRADARMQMVPASTGIGAPGTQPAPANLARSPMSAQPTGQQAAAIPFTRGSALATMQDATLSATVLTAGAQVQVQLQTNAFIQYVISDWVMTTAGNAATVVFAQDGPFSVIAKIQLDDPAGQSIITPITGYQLFLLNKYLPDSNCAFDPQRDPNYSAVTGAGGTGGSFSFRLILPIEHRARDAFGALNNSAANQRYLITLTTLASYTSTTLYSTPPTSAGTLTCQFSQWYWTYPPAAITTAQGSVPVAQTPPGLGSVGFVRFERHNEVSGGGAPMIQMNNVGDYISSLIFVLRASAGANLRDSADWPSPFGWWVNDFQVHQLFVNVWQRRMARAYGYFGAIGAVGGVDTGVFVLPALADGLFDDNSGLDNFHPANQYLATDATTKLQVRGTTFGAGSGFLEVLTRLIRPVSGAALFA